MGIKNKRVNAVLCRSILFFNCAVVLAFIWFGWKASVIVMLVCVFCNDCSTWKDLVCCELLGCDIKKLRV